jgi:hypothetical protein
LSNTNPTNNGGELRCSGKVCRPWFTSGTRRVTLVQNPVISHEGRKDWIMTTTNRTYPWSSVRPTEHIRGLLSDQQNISVVSCQTNRTYPWSSVRQTTYPWSSVRQTEHIHGLLSRQTEHIRGLLSRQTEHIRGLLWDRYFLMVNTIKMVG